MNATNATNTTRMTIPPHVSATLVSKNGEKYDRLAVAHRRIAAPMAGRCNEAACANEVSRGK
jgi:hypothetical protein